MCIYRGFKRLQEVEVSPGLRAEATQIKSCRSKEWRRGCRCEQSGEDEWGGEVGCGGRVGGGGKGGGCGGDAQP
jgi:hypothetical protein